MDFVFFFSQRKWAGLSIGQEIEGKLCICGMRMGIFLMFCYNGNLKNKWFEESFYSSNHSAETLYLRMEILICHGDLDQTDHHS